MKHECEVLYLVSEDDKCLAGDDIGLDAVVSYIDYCLYNLFVDKFIDQMTQWKEL